jgi:SpoVK/Ycf46/Vps4 family AAA+-type ATPase
MGDTPSGVVVLPLDPPDYARRRDYWRISLAAQGVAPSEADLDALAERFRLAPSQISRAVLSAREQARWRAAASGEIGEVAGDPAVSVDDLFRAARAQFGHELAELTRKIAPTYTWDDIVLPATSLDQLREICQRVAGQHRVLDDWGFSRKLSQAQGVSALFAGASGTGKTMAAEVVASELGLDLYRIDLSAVVSKYIGETEKNLKRIFDAAEDGNAILFFDEADALFGKRSEVRDSHDRYANVEISYLLQEMEQYAGVCILATNLRQNLDDAFVRRLAFTVHFPFPDESHRLRIWQQIWPVDTPLDAGVDLGFLASQFKLSGGNIRNIALGAAFLAAAERGVVTMDHLTRATQREYQKLGKTLSAAELYGEPEASRSNGGNVGQLAEIR